MSGRDAARENHVKLNAKLEPMRDAGPSSFSATSRPVEVIKKGLTGG